MKRAIVFHRLILKSYRREKSGQSKVSRAEIATEAEAGQRQVFCPILLPGDFTNPSVGIPFTACSRVRCYLQFVT